MVAAIDPEVDAMAKVAKALEGLEAEQQARVLRWAGDRYGVALGGRRAAGTDGGGVDRAAGGGGGGAAPDPGEYEEVGDLVAAARPETDADRALVVAYWLQVIQQTATFQGQQVNTELKNLGHGVDDVTKLIGSLVGTSPQLVLQTKKAGTSRQARKSYKLTRAGIKRVEEILDGAQQ